ncbi:MAG: sulfotransferase, partial [Chitinophagales bacterium]|nr:sulfotransferase [Chitinophagales bacterium]
QNFAWTKPKKERKHKVRGHLLYNALPHVWKTLRSENKIEGIYKKKARMISLMIRVMHPFQWIQQMLFKKRIEAIDFTHKQPVFILGHWRSGTTHLHYILHHDPQFGTLSNYQSFFV